MKFKSIFLLALIQLVGGCTGMNMDKDGFNTGGVFRVDDHARVSLEKDYQSRFTMVPINASAIVAQVWNKKQAPSRATPQLPVESHFIYRVGPQDVLQVTVWDHPELTTPEGQFRTAADTGNLVRRDGTIFYPYIGIVSVAGKSLEEIRTLLATKLSKYIPKPQVDVRVAAFRSQKVYITGGVATPGVQPVTDSPLHVLEAIQVAGGMQSGGQADLQNVKLNRDGKVYNIDVLSMLVKGDLSENIRLHDGDILHVPNNSNNKVFMLGEVGKPGTIFIQDGHMTLAEALSDAGGVNPTTSNAGQIYVIRGGKLVDSDLVQKGESGKLSVSFNPVIFQIECQFPRCADSS